MSTPEVPAEATVSAEVATEAAAAAARAQEQNRDPIHEDFYVHGREMAATLNALAALVGTLADQVGHYGDRRILRDDTGTDPTQRLAAAVGHLGQLGHALTTVQYHADRYCSEIGHIGVEVDPEAEPK